jgi:hypothetical protein
MEPARAIQVLQKEHQVLGNRTVSLKVDIGIGTVVKNVLEDSKSHGHSAQDGEPLPEVPMHRSVSLNMLQIRHVARCKTFDRTCGMFVMRVYNGKREAKTGEKWCDFCTTWRWSQHSPPPSISSTMITP